MTEIIDTNKVTIAFSSPYSLDFTELGKSLKERGYAPPSDQSIRLRLGESGEPIPVQRLCKESIELVYVQEKGFLALQSELTDTILSEIEHVHKIAVSLPSTTAHVKWFEINYSSRLHTENHPLNESARSNKAGAFFEKISGLEPRYFSRSLCSFDGDVPEIPLNQVPDWVHATVSVFVPNPRYHQTRIVCRRKSLEKTLEFYKQIPELISKLANPQSWLE